VDPSLLSMSRVNGPVKPGATELTSGRKMSIGNFKALGAGCSEENEPRQALANPSPDRPPLLLDRWRGRAQPFDKRRLDRVDLRALAASAQLLHQTADAQRTDAAKIVLDG
jgi:hypothetical protein